MLQAEAAGLGCLVEIYPREILCIKATSSPSLHPHHNTLARRELPRADWRCCKGNVTECAGCRSESIETRRPWRLGWENNRDGMLASIRLQSRRRTTARDLDRMEFLRRRSMRESVERERGHLHMIPVPWLATATCCTSIGASVATLAI
jgi:hypothetical protein